MRSMTLSQIRTVFMGTPTFAVPSFDALASAGTRIVAIVTQPDRPAGRGHGIRQSAIGIRADELNLPAFKPKGLKKEEDRAFLEDVRPELLVVVAYGEILPKAVLDLPQFGAVNVHASLLPKYRGPAPIPAAILAGDRETGVTIMKLDEGVDTGPILAQERVPITPADTTRTLSAKLADVGARLLVSSLERYLLGELSPTPQDHTQATTCPMLKKGHGKIDWMKPAEHIARMVRAYDPWPGAYTHWAGKQLLIRRAVPRLHETGSGAPESVMVPGTVFRDANDIRVQTGTGTLLLSEAQLEGGRLLPIADFLHGHPCFIGSVLG